MVKNEDTYCKVKHKIVRELGAWEAVVYGTIADILRKKHGYGNVSNDTLINLIGRDKKSIYRWIDRLVDAGYLEKVGGKGRGNISIYYITKKGGNMTPFEEEKRGQIDTEKGANMTEKGGEMPPINKGENKEINKESGGDMRTGAQSHTLSITPQNFENMEDFKEWWDLFTGGTEFQSERENCERVWYSLQQSWRDNLVQMAKNGMRWRQRENDNPYWYLKNYSGETVRYDLPIMRQGTAAFTKWLNDSIRSGHKVCVMLMGTGDDTHCVYCLERDKETCEAAGMRFVRYQEL